jgi:hypothetical protein
VTLWGQNRSGKAGDPDAVQRWTETTPKVLQDAIQAGWNGTATAQQKRLLKNWVTARVMGASIESSELLLAHLDAKKRGK